MFADVMSQCICLLHFWHHVVGPVKGREQQLTNTQVLMNYRQNRSCWCLCTLSGQRLSPKQRYCRMLLLLLFLHPPWHAD
jgi:hypothetical protein